MIVHSQGSTYIGMSAPDYPVGTYALEPQPDSSELLCQCIPDLSNNIPANRQWMKSNGLFQPVLGSGRLPLPGEEIKMTNS